MFAAHLFYLRSNQASPMLTVEFFCHPKPSRIAASTSTENRTSSTGNLCRSLSSAFLSECLLLWEAAAVLFLTATAESVREREFPFRAVIQPITLILPWQQISLRSLLRMFLFSKTNLIQPNYQGKESPGPPGDKHWEICSPLIESWCLVTVPQHC